MRILILVVFVLPLLISPFGAADLLIPSMKVVAQQSYHAAMTMGHASVSAVKSGVERTVNKKSLE